MEVNRGKPCRHFLHCGPEIPVAYVGADINLSRASVVRDDVRRGVDTDIGYLAEGRRPPPGMSIGISRRAVRSCLSLGNAPEPYVTDTAGPIEVTDLLSGDHRRDRPPDITGLEPKALCRFEIHPNIDLRNVDLKRNMFVHHASGICQRMFDLSRLCPQDFEISPIDTRNDGFTSTRKYLANARFEIGLYMPPQARLASNDLLNRAKRPVITGTSVDADPVCLYIHDCRAEFWQHIKTGTIQLADSH